MKGPSMPTIGFSAVGLAGLLLISIGPPRSRPPSQIQAVITAGSRVAANGFELVSTSIDLPQDEERFTGAPYAEIVNANCLSCHSASMVLNQPPLARAQWRSIVEKMQHVYHAPVAAQDIPKILQYLAAREEIGSHDATLGGPS